MWIDDDRLTRIAALETGTYPRKCPICGNNSIHMLMYRHSVISSGGGSWIWCSSCKRYSHLNAEIPEWWTNFDGLEAGQLFASPEYNIDDNNEAIDRWVNKLLSAKHDCPKEPPKSVTDDKTLYVIRIVPQKIMSEEKSELAAQLCRCDKEQALEMLETDGFELFPMPATDIRIVKDELEAKNISFVISPEYKW